MNNEYLPQNRFLRLRQVMELISLSRTKIYDMQAEGTFPRSFQLTEHAVAWLESEVAMWMAERVRTAH